MLQACTSTSIPARGGPEFNSRCRLAKEAVMTCIVSVITQYTSTLTICQACISSVARLCRDVSCVATTRDCCCSQSAQLSYVSAKATAVDTNGLPVRRKHVAVCFCRRHLWRSTQTRECPETLTAVRVRTPAGRSLRSGSAP